MFSRVAQSYRCPTCDKVYSKAIATSLLPMLVVVFVGAVFWGKLVSLILEVKVLPYLIGGGVSFLSLLVFSVLLDTLMNPWANSKRCPKCHDQLVASGGGFVDGGFPDGKEVLLYLIVVAVPAGIWGLSLLVG